MAPVCSPSSRTGDGHFILSAWQPVSLSSRTTCAARRAGGKAPGAAREADGRVGGAVASALCFARTVGYGMGVCDREYKSHGDLLE
jgi:hypothetical protein